jgi:hypothetical protein
MSIVHTFTAMTPSGPVAFTISEPNLATGNNGRDNLPCIANFRVVVGPFDFYASLASDGSVCLPHTLRDWHLIAAIGAEIRALVLTKLTSRWGNLTHLEGVQLAARPVRS